MVVLWLSEETITELVSKYLCRQENIFKKPRSLKAPVHVYKSCHFYQLGLDENNRSKYLFDAVREASKKQIFFLQSVWVQKEYTDSLKKKSEQIRFRIKWNNAES